MSSTLTSWVSPALMVQKNCVLSELRAEKGWVLWLERRPDEGGRSVVVTRASNGQLYDLTPQGSDVGTGVHVYGGGAWAAYVTTQGVDVVYSDGRQGGVWLSRHGQPAVAWCSAAHENSMHCQYADFSFSSSGEQVFCVRECHQDGKETAQIVSITQQGDEHVWAQGADFYAAPRLSPDGCFLAWIEWDNPHMPWTETRLCVMSLMRGARPFVLEGKDVPCSVMEPFWDGTTRLYALSDRPTAGHERAWTPVTFVHHKGKWQSVPLPHAGCEIGLPAWVFGQRSCVPFSHEGLLARGLFNGAVCIMRYDPQQGWQTTALQGMPENVPFPLGDGSGRVAWIDAPSDQPPSIAVGTLDGVTERFHQAWSLPPGVTDDDIATPECVQVEVTEGPGLIHALFYPPARGKNCVSPDAQPPLVTIVHGGPTGQSRTDLSFKVQWWTSRGFAVLDVNYRGSTGFGRAYREALNGQWGVRDVHDCCAVVQHMVEQGRVDPARCVIRGSSAGGLTVLSALAQSDLFVAGTSLYGVTDLCGLVADTHRFEARYLDRLIAPWPEGQALYRERSPLSWSEKIKAPVLFLHGDADKVVPLSQAEALVAQLEEQRLHVYPGEGHGFRTADVIVDSLTRELAFYQEIFAR